LQAGCGELSESKNKNNNNILTENYSCAELLGDLIPEGDQVTDETCQTIYEQAMEQFDAATAKGEALASYYGEQTHFSTYTGDGADYNTASNVLETDIFERGVHANQGAMEAMKALTQRSQALMGISNHGMLTDPEQALSQALSKDAQSFIKSAISNSSAYAEAAGESLGGDYKSAIPLMDYVSEIDSEHVSIMSAGLIEYKQIRHTVHSVYTKVIQSSPTSIVGKAVDAADVGMGDVSKLSTARENLSREAKETRLDESQVKRLKKLAGIV
jgi:hypothetical protein